jgi:hypothetical protein
MIMYNYKFMSQRWETRQRPYRALKDEVESPYASILPTY